MLAVACLLAALAVTGCRHVAAGKVLAVAVDVLGPDPFSETAFGQDTRSVVPNPVGGTRAGDVAGLYGGSLNKRACDKSSLVRFLTAAGNRAKARVWAEVLGISADHIAGYVRTLTPVLLRNDTLVTNHGFKNGAKTVFQALLEAGVAVLVDRLGRPVVKCNCGNPLADPIERPDDLTPDLISDPRWKPRFEVRKVTVVRRSTTKRVRRFHLADIGSGRGIGRPAGSDGGRDLALPAPPVLSSVPEEPAASPPLSGTWRASSYSSSLIRVEPAGPGTFTGVIARELRIGDGCVLEEGRKIWSVEGTGPHYAGSLVPVAVEDCRDLPEVPVTWELKDGDTLVVCVTLDRRRCETWVRSPEA
ncbi:hypothetical protein GCM10022226_45040 [Sphaerisporangium flaviroseum]|uniref:DUF6777 domain-containing protein n=2 Tax=Sphaerisporangium flaviroseum TaxID=509199 RepID=A0ABP7IJ86_9ACTN